MLKILKTNQPLLILKSALLLGGCLQGEDHGGRWVGGGETECRNNNSGGYSGVKRIGMTVGNPRKLP